MDIFADSIAGMASGKVSSVYKSNAPPVFVEDLQWLSFSHQTVRQQTKPQCCIKQASLLQRTYNIYIYLMRNNKTYQAFHRYKQGRHQAVHNKGSWKTAFQM